jgi:hypothetical protein
MKEIPGNVQRAQLTRLWALLSFGALTSFLIPSAANAAPATTASSSDRPSPETLTTQVATAVPLAIEAAAKAAAARASAVAPSMAEPTDVNSTTVDTPTMRTTAANATTIATETTTIAADRPTIVAITKEESIEDLRQRLLIEPLVQLRAPGYSPGSSAGGPTAFGANFGDAYIGVSGSNRRAKVNEADGSMGLGFGLGDSSKYAGLEVSVNLGSIRKFAANGEVGFKLHRKLSSDSAIAIGYDSGVVWGKDNQKSISTVYGVVSKVMKLRPDDSANSLPLTLSVGIGGGRFRSLDDVINQRSSVGLFGSLGLQVSPQASLVSTWTGRDLNLGVSFVPIRTTPLFVTAVAANVLRRDDNATVFSLSIGYGFNFLR